MFLSVFFSYTPRAIAGQLLHHFEKRDGGGGRGDFVSRCFDVVAEAFPKEILQQCAATFRVQRHSVRKVPLRDFRSRK